MKTNHRRGFVASTTTDPNLFRRMTKKLASGKAVSADTGGCCESHHNAAQHAKAAVKRALRQAERRDAVLVIAEQLEVK